MIESLIEMTWRNPIFMGVAILAVWFIPGIVFRRIAEKRYNDKKAMERTERISRLYPDKDNFN